MIIIMLWDLDLKSPLEAFFSNSPVLVSPKSAPQVALKTSAFSQNFLEICVLQTSDYIIIQDDKSRFGPLLR